jgi:hypothetical protein
VAGTVDFRNDQFAELLSQRHLATSEDRFRLRIPVSDAAFLVDLDEGVERGIDDAARRVRFRAMSPAPAGFRSCRGRQLVGRLRPRTHQDSVTIRPSL